MKHFILDLDQTIICAEKPSVFKQFTDKHFQKIGPIHKMGNNYTISERPHLQKFLDYIFKHYRVSVWTAASKDYALFIIENIVLQDKSRKINYILYDDHCDYSYKNKNAIKSLSILWEMPGFTDKNTLILDDNLDVYNAQPNNCIRAYPYYVTELGKTPDNFLLFILTELKKCKKQTITNAKDIVKKINAKQQY